MESKQKQLKITIRDLPLEKMEANFVFPWEQVGNINELVIGLTTKCEVSRLQDIQALLKN